MGIYRRKDSLFWWMRLDGVNRRLSTKVLVDADTAIERQRQRESAEAIYRAHMTDLARLRHDLPPHLETPGVTFQTFSEWYDTHVIPTHRGVERERELLKVLRSQLAHLELSAITRDVVQEYRSTRLAAKKRPGTVNREVALLKSILREASHAGHLKVSPLVGMPMLRTTRRPKRVLTTAEEGRLLEKLAPADRALFIVAVDTLVRLTNVLNLTRGEDRGAFLALEDSKTGPYEVPLSTRARAALDSLPNDGPYFFPGRRTAKTERDRRGIIRRMLQRACAKCDPPVPYGRAIAGVTFHTATRATGATRMLRAGVDPKTVQAVGNWDSFEQMGEYLQASDMVSRTAAVNLIGPPAKPDGT